MAECKNARFSSFTWYASVDNISPVEWFCWTRFAPNDWHSHSNVPKNIAEFRILRLWKSNSQQSTLTWSLFDVKTYRLFVLRAKKKTTFKHVLIKMSEVLILADYVFVSNLSLFTVFVIFSGQLNRVCEGIAPCLRTLSNLYFVITHVWAYCTMTRSANGVIWWNKWHLFTFEQSLKFLLIDVLVLEYNGSEFSYV